MSIFPFLEHAKDGQALKKGAEKVIQRIQNNDPPLIICEEDGKALAIAFRKIAKGEDGQSNDASVAAALVNMLQACDIQDKGWNALIANEISNSMALIIKEGLKYKRNHSYELVLSKFSSLQYLFTFVTSIASSLSRLEYGSIPENFSCLAAEMIPVALETLLLQSPKGLDSEASYFLRGLKGAAIESILEFISYDQRNCQYVCSYAKFARKLTARKIFRNLLQYSKGFILQLDITECMFHCHMASKKFSEDPAFTPPQEFPFNSILGQLAGQETDDVAISRTLHHSIASFNRSLGAQATVCSIQAQNIVINGRSNIAADGMWVDFAEDHFVIGIAMSNGTADGNPKNMRRSSLSGAKHSKENQDCSSELLPPQYLTVKLSRLKSRPLVTRNAANFVEISMKITCGELIQDLVESGISDPAPDASIILELEDAEVNFLKQVPSISSQLLKHGLLHYKDSHYLSKEFDLADLSQPDKPVKTSIVSLSMKKPCSVKPSVLQQIKYHNQQAASKINGKAKSVSKPEEDNMKSKATPMNIMDQFHDSHPSGNCRQNFENSRVAKTVRDNCISTNASPRPKSISKKDDTEKLDSNHAKIVDESELNAVNSVDSPMANDGKRERQRVAREEYVAPTHKIVGKNTDNANDRKESLGANSDYFESKTLGGEDDKISAFRKDPSLPDWVDQQMERKTARINQSHLLSLSSSDEEGEVKADEGKRIASRMEQGCDLIEKITNLETKENKAVKNNGDVQLNLAADGPRERRTLKMTDVKGGNGTNKRSKPRPLIRETSEIRNVSACEKFLHPRNIVRKSKEVFHGDEKSAILPEKEQRDNEKNIGQNKKPENSDETHDRSSKPIMDEFDNDKLPLTQSETKQTKPKGFKKGSETSKLKKLMPMPTEAITKNSTKFPRKESTLKKGKGRLAGMNRLGLPANAEQKPMGSGEENGNKKNIISSSNQVQKKLGDPTLHLHARKDKPDIISPEAKTETPDIIPGRKRDAGSEKAKFKQKQRVLNLKQEKPEVFPDESYKLTGSKERDNGIITLECSDSESSECEDIKDTKLTPDKKRASRLAPFPDSENKYTSGHNKNLGVGERKSKRKAAVKASTAVRRTLVRLESFTDEEEEDGYPAENIPDDKKEETSNINIMNGIKNFQKENLIENSRELSLHFTGDQVPELLQDDKTVRSTHFARKQQRDKKHEGEMQTLQTMLTSQGKMNKRRQKKGTLTSNENNSGLMKDFGSGKLSTEWQPGKLENFHPVDDIVDKKETLSMSYKKQKATSRIPFNMESPRHHLNYNGIADGDIRILKEVTTFKEQLDGNTPSFQRKLRNLGENTPSHISNTGADVDLDNLFKSLNNEFMDIATEPSQNITLGVMDSCLGQKRKRNRSSCRKLGNNNLRPLRKNDMSHLKLLLGEESSEDEGMLLRRKETSDSEHDEDEDTESARQICTVLQFWKRKQDQKAEREKAAKAAVVNKEVTHMIVKAREDVESEKQEAIQFVKEQIQTIEDKLNKKQRQIEETQAEYEAKLAKLREESSILQSQAESALQKGRHHIACVEASNKRKLRDVYTLAKEKIAVGQRSIERAAKKARKLPTDLLAFLTPFFSGS